jgi:ABC-type transporter Mla subunit MlaD
MIDRIPEFTDEAPRHAGRKALWFTLVPLLAVLVLLGVVAWKQHYFSATDRLYAFADSSAGIAVGMPVKIQGFAVGAVKDMALIPPESGKPPKVRLELEVNRNYLGYIGKDSVLRLSHEGLIGQPILEILQGDMRARRAADADVLAFDRPRTLNEMAEDLNARTAPLLADMKELAQKLKDPEGDFMRTLGTARQIVQHVDDTTVAVGALAKSGENVVGKVGAQAERAMTAASRLLERVDGNMPKAEGVLDNLLETSKRVNAAAGSIDGVVGRAGGMVGEGEQLIGEAGQIVRKAKRSWPLSVWAAPEPSSLVTIDSQDNGKSFIEPRPKVELK